MSTKSTVLGLTGGVPTSLRRDLLELSQIRNVLVHRAGIVDKRLAEACPWLKLQTGNRVQVTDEAYTRYSLAVPQYVRSVVKRLEERRKAKDRTQGPVDDASDGSGEEAVQPRGSADEAGLPTEPRS